MLNAHFEEIERSLIATGRIPRNAGHTLHKGNPREAFIKIFLEAHLSERVGIGTGEIFDARSKPGEQRNQIDLIIYKREYPKIHFGGQVNGFFAESVIATIEVKSRLTKEELTKAVNVARKLKRLQRNLDTAFTVGYIPPSILSYVVAFDGPAKMSTVRSWIRTAHQSLGIKAPRMKPNGADRYKTPSPSIDGVFVLGGGFVHFDNSPLGFITPQMRTSHPQAMWVTSDGREGNLLLLFVLLTQAVSGLAASWLDVVPYLKPYAKSIKFE